jgi:hypothetical protein
MFYIFPRTFELLSYTTTLSSKQQTIHKISKLKPNFNLWICSCSYTNLQKDQMKRIDSPWSIDRPNDSPMWWQFNFSMFYWWGSRNNIMHMTLCICVRSNAQKQKTLQITWEEKWRDGKRGDRVRKHECENQGSLTFQQMGTSTLQHGSWWRIGGS